MITSPLQWQGFALPDWLRVCIWTMPGTDCWIYDRKWNSGNGYSKIRLGGEPWMVHRLTYSIVMGHICPFIILDHKCRNRWCVNPFHLDPVTTGVNTHRGEAILYSMKTLDKDCGA